MARSEHADLEETQSRSTTGSRISRISQPSEIYYQNSFESNAGDDVERQKRESSQEEHRDVLKDPSLVNMASSLDLQIMRLMSDSRSLGPVQTTLETQRTGRSERNGEPLSSCLHTPS